MFFLSYSCNVTLRNAFTQYEMSDGNYEIAQLFPSYDKVTLSNNCILTCRQQSNGHGGILALRAKAMNIDGNSKILNTGKGMSSQEPIVMGSWSSKLSRFHEINMSQSSSRAVGVTQSVSHSVSQSVSQSVGQSVS